MSEETKEEVLSFDTMQIMDMIPHRYPFLLVDRITECVPGKYSKGYKNLTFNEPFFQGHFPSKPVLPGVLILEAMAQATGILAFTMVGKPQPGELYYFASIDNARFKHPVVPGDQLILEVEYLKERRGIAKFTGVASVNGEVVCTADLMCAKRKD